MADRDQPYLKVPEQNQTTLSFCDPTARELKAWVNDLPMANIGEVSRQLYHAIIEFNRLKVSDTARIELMDLVRGPIHFVCKQLNARYLNQGVVLDDQQRKVANLAQAMQNHLGVGYKIIIEHLLASGSLKHKGLLAKSVHRAMNELLPTVLRAYQLYLPTPEGIWREIHQLYQIVSGSNQQNEPIEDPLEGPALTIAQTYIKIVLLGACQPNQLLQRELEVVFASLGQWASHLSIDEVANEKSVLVINPNLDCAAYYRYLTKTSNLSDYLGVNVLPLVRMLHNDHKTLSSPDQGHGLKAVKADFNLNLLEHLIQSWGGMKQRGFSRSTTGGELSMAVGLTATHFHIAGGIGFDALLCGASSAHDMPFLNAEHKRFHARDTQSVRAQQDVWAGSFDADGATKMIQDEDTEFNIHQQETHPDYGGQLVNVSPRGYCLQWRDAPASNLQTGEVIAIKEDAREHWNLGLVRWIRQGTAFGTQIGVELLAPNSQPCGIRQLQKTGVQGDYMRALYIPEIKAIGQEASILTPRMPFNVGNKVTVNRGGNQDTFQLTKRILTTSIISQFHIRAIAHRHDSVAVKTDVDERDNFASLWRQL
jgi:hypothetical protein